MDVPTYQSGFTNRASLFSKLHGRITVSFKYTSQPERISTEAHFENIQARIIDELLKARDTVRICVAWMSSEVYASTLQDIANSGVRVELIFNDDLINKKNLSTSSDKINFYPIKTKKYATLMHNKFCIIDESIVITGSYNWSKRASQHFENIIIVRNDYKLVAQFMHEFHDLIHHYSESHDLVKISCKEPKCRSEAYNVGVLGSESGLYDESILGIWNICCSNGHITFIKEATAIHLRMMLGLKEDSELDDDMYELDKPQMLRRFQTERSAMQSMQDVFTKQLGILTHAIGYIYVTNENEHIEWNQTQEFAIGMLWRHMYYRKMIPENIFDGDNDVDITPIVDRHY